MGRFGDGGRLLLRTPNSALKFDIVHVLLPFHAPDFASLASLLGMVRSHT